MLHPAARTLNATIATAIKKARHASGITQIELGSRIGMNQRRVSWLESGKSGMRIGTLQKIANATGQELIVELTLRVEPIRGKEDG